MRAFHHHILNLAERRHVIGGATILGLFYFGPYLPTAVTLGLFLGVACMAVTTHADSLKVGIIASASFMMGLLMSWSRGWRSLSGEALTPSQAVEEASVLMMLVTLAFGTVSWISRLLRSESAKLDKVLEACNLYLWIGGTFAFAYTIVERINPHAFRHAHFISEGSVVTPVTEWKNDIQQMLYYSFVTQTTIGFGDILPVNHIARVLTITQAVIGQFYVAVVLAYILNLWIHDLDHRTQARRARTESKEVSQEPPRR